MKNIYIVTSLPRTGTTSLCEMANICGLKSLHVLKHISFIDALNFGYNFFADTPFYSYDFLIGVLETLDPKQYSVHFIYSHKDFESHKRSLNKLLSLWLPKKNNFTDKIHFMDYLCYKNLNDNFIKNHYKYICYISKLYNIKILDYKFSDEWSIFCDFINVQNPSVPLPKIDCFKK